MIFDPTRISLSESVSTIIDQVRTQIVPSHAHPYHTPNHEKKTNAIIVRGVPSQCERCSLCLVREVGQNWSSKRTCHLSLSAGKGHCQVSVIPISFMSDVQLIPPFVCITYHHYHHQHQRRGASIVILLMLSRCCLGGGCLLRKNIIQKIMEVLFTPHRQWQQEVSSPLEMVCLVFRG